MTTRALILDFDGVVADSGFHAAVAALAGRLGHAPAVAVRAAMRALRASGYLTGKASEAHFWAALEAELGGRADMAAFRAALIAGSRPRARVLRLARDLADLGWRTAVLSDHTDWLDEIETRTPFGGAFAVVRNSYYTGSTKGEPAAFEGALEALGVRPEHAVFADDNPRNVSVARACALRAVVYDDHGWPALCAALTGAGVPAALLREAHPAR